MYKQQLASIGLEGNNERRYFSGVPGVKGQEGELFGLLNLLRHKSESFNTGTFFFFVPLSIENNLFIPADIISKAHKEEQEYRIEEQEVKDDEEEGLEKTGDSTMNDLFLEDTNGILDLTKIRNGRQRII